MVLKYLKLFFELQGLLSVQINKSFWSLWLPNLEGIYENKYIGSRYFIKSTIQMNAMIYEEKICCTIIKDYVIAEKSLKTEITGI